MFVLCALVNYSCIAYLLLLFSFFSPAYHVLTVDAEIFKGILFSRLGLTSKFKSSNY